MSTTTSRSSSSPRDGDARTLAEALGMTAPAGAITPEPLRPDPTSAGHLRIDKCGALEGQPKLKAVRAYERPGPPRDFTPGGRQVADVVTSKVATRPPGAKPKKATLPPKLGSMRPPELVQEASNGNGPVPSAPAGVAVPAVEADDVRIPAGTFLFGEEREARSLPSFRIDRFPVTHADYEAFVRATGHRAPLYWPGGSCPDDLRAHPVVGVDYFDALAYAAWKGKDLPYEDEWERAARGVDGRSYPWGNDPDVQVANTARSGIKMTVPVGFYPQNVSPEGVRDLVGNTWEFTHSSAPGGGVVVRGGSWYDFALYAKTYFRFAARTDARNGTIGFRCVTRDAERDDAQREVDEITAEGEIRQRRTTESPPDVSRFSAERRDLVPDHRRLKILVGENAATRVAEAKSEASSSTSAPVAPPPAPPPAVSVAKPQAAKPAPTERVAAMNAAFDAFGTAPAAPAAPAKKPVEAKPPERKAPEAKAPEAPAPSIYASIPKPPPAPPRASESRAAPAAAAPPPPRATPAHGTPVPTGAAVASAAPLHVESPAAPRPPPASTSTSGFDRVGLQKATESAVSSRRAAPAPGETVAPKSTPLLWWGLLGGGVVLCLVLLITLISNLMKDGGNPDPDDGTEMTSIERHPGDGTEELPAPAPGEGTGETPSEAPPETPSPAPPVPPVVPPGKEPSPPTPPPSETHPPQPAPPSVPVKPPVVKPPVAPPAPPAEMPPAETPPAETPPVTPPEEPVVLPPPPGDELHVPGLPDATAGPGDAGPPVLLDGAAGPWDAKVKEGVWLVVFAPTPETPAASTIKAVNSLHRRFRKTAVRVLLVVPRADFQDASGELLPPADVRKKLAAYGATSDVHVLLDAPAGTPHGTAARNQWGVRRPTTALVLQRGREQGRTSPPDAAFSLLTLSDIAIKALARTASAVPGR